jgi:hypothetical protein
MPLETNGFYTNIEELVVDTRMGRPHVVILGAGASLQAFPDGDRKGQRLPLMYDLVEVVGLRSLLEEQGISYRDRNFEEIYSDLYEDSCYEYLIDIIRNRVREYFGQLELPDYPTLYDHLVLSLREKDLIATFNWDPLLYRSCWRNNQRAKPPHVVYLHGNVAVGYCLENNTTGWTGSKCSECGRNFTPSNLLYPIRRKSYSQDPFITAEWETLRQALGHAYILTLFGYGAPQSDVEAIELMISAWGDKYQRAIEHTEIIDIKSHTELRDTWKELIHTDHYNVTNDFYESLMGLFPRRTCEAQWNYDMPEKVAFYPQNPIPRKLGFAELWEWYSPLIEAEKKRAQT